MVVFVYVNLEWDSFCSCYYCFIVVVDLSGLDSDFVSVIGSVRVYGDDEIYIVDDCLCVCCVYVFVFVNLLIGG